MAYLDYAATSPLLPEVKAAMLAAMDLSMGAELGNSMSLHHAGHRASNIIEDARATIAELINADPAEIIFTSGGTESNNTVMHIFEGGHIITSPFEHSSVLEAAKEYAGEYGEVVSTAFEAEAPLQATPLACKDRPSKERAGETTPRTLYSVMLANNETGDIFPIKELAEQAHARGAFFHTDVTQALGKIKIDVKDLGVDYLTASAHKIGGPIGIGILYVKTGAPFRPLLLGGHQENSRRAGTSQTINIAGFGAAARYTIEHKTWDLYHQKIRPLRDELARRILVEIPYSSLNSAQTGQQLPHILNASFRAAEGESIQLYLDLEGNIQVSTGSACASGDGQPSHVLMALTHDAEIAHSSIRFSLSLNTTEDDINHLMHHLPQIIKKLQGISTIKTVQEEN